jgi:hypothetical protein
MPPRSGRNATPRVAVCALAVCAAGCSHLHWPWHHQPPPPPKPVHELDITSAGATATYAQYWQRNTLVVDLSAAGGSGSITLKPAAGTTWPVRLAFRVTPGAMGVLDVRAAQRASLPVTPAGGKPIDLELDPGVYQPATPEMTVSWQPTGSTAP